MTKIIYEGDAMKVVKWILVKHLIRSFTVGWTGWLRYIRCTVTWSFRFRTCLLIVAEGCGGRELFWLEMSDQWTSAGICREKFFLRFIPQGLLWILIFGIESVVWKSRCKGPLSVLIDWSENLVFLNARCKIIFIAILQIWKQWNQLPLTILYHYQMLPSEAIPEWEIKLAKTVAT